MQPLETYKRMLKDFLKKAAAIDHMAEGIVRRRNNDRLTPFERFKLTSRQERFVKK